MNYITTEREQIDIYIYVFENTIQAVDFLECRNSILEV